ncbi:hypothetical protein C8R46DRAFT_1027693 [Mycena filopes]|nr:hypothetical protein C8R46DRAFT_1027693 [Mycena filopes]
MTTRKIARGRREVAERFTWRSKKGNESNFAGKVPREREMSRLFQTWSSFQPTPQASIPSVGAVLIGAYFRTKLSMRLEEAVKRLHLRVRIGALIISGVIFRLCRLARVAVRIYIATYITVNRLLAGARTMASSNLRMLYGNGIPVLLPKLEFCAVADFEKGNEVHPQRPMRRAFAIWPTTEKEFPSNGTVEGLGFHWQTVQDRLELRSK